VRGVNGQVRSKLVEDASISTATGKGPIHLEQCRGEHDVALVRGFSLAAEAIKSLLGPAPDGHRPPGLQSETTALVIIDMQRDIVLPGGFGEKLGNDTSLLLAAR
jgi:hypothetical protein